MKKSSKTTGRLSPGQFHAAAAQLRVTGPICLGNVFVRHYQRPVAGRVKRFGPYYVWTRKIKARTVTTALSRPQYLALRAAIVRHRALARQLQRLRDLSLRLILETNPGVRNRLRKSTLALS